MQTAPGHSWHVTEYRAGPRRGRRRARRLVAALVTTAVLTAATVVAVVVWGRSSLFNPPTCTVGGYQLEPSQAAYAATIAGVGLRMGLPAHAVTVALATALQESKLENVDYGTSDSLGLFQQRPSQGWGTPAEVMNPDYASAAFYTHLAAVPGWRTMSVADAAQAVQRSADGSAYGEWASEADSMAIALVGQQAAGVSCSGLTGPVAAGTATPPGLLAAAAADLGSNGLLDTPVTVTRGWVVASWMVAHAQAQGLSAVAFDGQRWTRRSGRWAPDHLAGQVVTVT